MSPRRRAAPSASRRAPAQCRRAASGRRRARRGMLWPYRKARPDPGSRMNACAAVRRRCRRSRDRVRRCPERVRPARRLKCWNTMPILRRASRSWSGFMSVNSSAPTVTVPESGRSSRFTARMRVLLPAPLWPMTPKISPAETSRLTSCSAAVTASPERKVLETWLTEITGREPEVEVGVACGKSALRAGHGVPQSASVADGFVTA